MLWNIRILFYTLSLFSISTAILLLSYLLVNRAPNFEKLSRMSVFYTIRDARVQHDVSYYMLPFHSLFLM
jgi:hypothetical protein